ncbi:MAG: nucleotidyl transferase AbiEii/AbiGii toxin family protein [Clostridia bacterium]|nr:nucleotidyl transferase AbiEii/AbiGii toxin family protein [Clostridia bacterium]
MFGYFIGVDNQITSSNLIANNQIAYVREYNNPMTIFEKLSRDLYVKKFASKKHFSGKEKQDNFEKACRLIEILDFIFTQWSDKFVLKGGTAINLFYHNEPRLSVDIDLDYVGRIDQTEEEVAVDIEYIEQKLDKHLFSKGYSLEELYDVPKNSFISKTYGFQNLKGKRDSIKVEIKYNDRAQLFEPEEIGFE